MGALVGSFVSAVSFRYPRGINFVSGRSFCPKCRSNISFYDNIPLISFSLLGAKCRSCKKKISIRYPLIEISCALGFLAIHLMTLPFYIYLVFIVLISLFVMDIEERIIPDEFVFVTSFLVLTVFLITDFSGLYSHLLSGFLAAVFLLLIHLVTRGKGMGLGDVKFAILAGIILGYPLFVIWLFLSFLTGALVAIILILTRKAGLKDKIAFGPFLIVSLVISYLWGEAILRAIF
ncbi:prepilin peptidase [Patescibacteria group bacterium]